MCTCVAWVRGYVLLRAPGRWLMHHIMAANGQQATSRFNGVKSTLNTEHCNAKILKNVSYKLGVANRDMFLTSRIA